MTRNILLIAVIALLFRLMFVVIFPGPNYFEGISRPYLEVAQNVIDGRGAVLNVDVGRIGDVSKWEYHPFIDRPLGYVFLVLLPGVFTSSPVGVQVLHSILSALSAVILFFVGREIFGERTAFWGALLYAIWPLSARFEIAILPDGVMPFFILATLWLVLRGIKSGTVWFGLAGLVCGVGMTMRPDIMLLPLVLAAGLFFCMKVRSGSVVLLAGVVLVVGLHTVRNYDVTGEIAPLGLGNGVSMWEGISQFGDTLGTVYGDEKMAEREGYRDWAYPNGVERDRKRFGEAVKIISENPAWYAGVMMKRIPVLLTPSMNITPYPMVPVREFMRSPENTALAYFLLNPLPVAVRLLVVLLQYLSLVLAVYALWVHLGNGLLWLPAAVIAYYVIIHLPTNTESRYFYPVIPLVLMLAASGFEKKKEFVSDMDAERWAT